MVAPWKSTPGNFRTWYLSVFRSNCCNSFGFDLKIRYHRFPTSWAVAKLTPHNIHISFTCCFYWSTRKFMFGSELHLFQLKLRLQYKKCRYLDSQLNQAVISWDPQTFTIYWTVYIYIYHLFTFLTTDIFRRFFAVCLDDIMTCHEMFCHVDLCRKLLAQQACRLINSGTSSMTQHQTFVKCAKTSISQNMSEFQSCPWNQNPTGSLKFTLISGKIPNIN